MAIRNRANTQVYDNQVAASGTDFVLFAFPMPKAGKVKSVVGWLKTKTGTNAAQLNVYKSGAASSTAAASTTAVNSAAMDMTSDAIVTAALTDANTRFIDNEVIYVKATTGSTTTMDNVSVTVVVDY